MKLKFEQRVKEMHHKRTLIGKPRKACMPFCWVPILLDWKSGVVMATLSLHSVSSFLF